MSGTNEHDVKFVTEPKEFFEKNYWLGANELVILGQYNVRYKNYAVRERYEGYDIVYRGTYEECVNYCEKAYLIYVTSLFHQLINYHLDVQYYKSQGMTSVQAQCKALGILYKPELEPIL